MDNQDNRKTPRRYEAVLLMLPALSLAGLGLLAHFNCYHFRNPSDAIGFIKAALSLRWPAHYFVILLTLQGVFSVIVALVLFLQIMLDRVPLPFDGPDRSLK